MPVGTCAWAASVARGCVEVGGRDLKKQPKEYSKLSGMMCWDAVMQVARLAMVLDAARYKALMTLTDKEDRIVTINHPQVVGAGGMHTVPEGHLLGFFDRQQKLVHAMISVGHGRACGNKNDCVGVGHMFGWENLDLAGGLSWSLNGDVLAPKGKNVSRLLEIHHRPITDLITLALH